MQSTLFAAAALLALLLAAGRRRAAADAARLDRRLDELRDGRI